MITKTFKRFAATTFLCILAAAMISCGVQLCHATTTGHTNSLGVITSETDPNMSLVGSIVSGQAVSDDDGRQGTALRIHPVNTYGLFDETIVFCGDESLRVTSAGGKLISGNYAFIFRRAASRLIKGVPCFALQSIYKLEPPRKG